MCTGYILSIWPSCTFCTYHTALILSVKRVLGWVYKFRAHVRHSTPETGMSLVWDYHSFVREYTYTVNQTSYADFPIRRTTRIVLNICCALSLSWWDKQLSTPENQNVCADATMTHTFPSYTGLSTVRDPFYCHHMANTCWFLRTTYTYDILKQGHVYIVKLLTQKIL